MCDRNGFLAHLSFGDRLIDALFGVAPPFVKYSMLTTNRRDLSLSRVIAAEELSSRDLVQMMAGRGIALAHTTILRWVQRYVPDFEKRWNQYARPVGDS